MNKFTKSQEYLKKVQQLIPSCTQTFSKSPKMFVQGVTPVFLEKGKGSHVWDIDGNEFIDYLMGLGPIILGYSYEKINKTIINQLDDGTIFSLPHLAELKLAEILVNIIPCAEMVRFGKNGSDATTGAVRVARAFTGRDKIVCCGYHGWHDWYISTTTRNQGIPRSTGELTLTFEYNNIESLKNVFDKNKDEIAAVIMEPIGVIEPKDSFLEEVKELAHSNGSLLIFDEIITGFRLALGGAQEYFSVTPDLACFGKAIANGMPISAVVGREKIMTFFDEVFYSFTFGGDVLSLMAAITTIEELAQKNVIDYLWDKGARLKKGYNSLVQKYALSKYTSCIGLPPRTVINFNDDNGNDSLEMRTLFQQETAKRGILSNGTQFISYSHSEDDINKTLNAYEETLLIIQKALDSNDIKRYINGPIVQPVFRKA